MGIATIRKLLPWGLLTAICAAGMAQTSSPKVEHPKHAVARHATPAHPHAHPITPSHGKTHGKFVRPPGPRHVHSKRRPRSARSIARSRHLQQAFVASSQLRPMAQFLAANRTPAAYEGVTAYARSHSGEAASAAYLALGHAYFLDRRYPEAVASFAKARAEGKTLDDYADFLTAQAEMQAGKLADAQTVLTGFAAKYPESIFVASLPVMIANLSIGQGDPQSALRALRGHDAEALSSHVDYLFALAKANQMAGNSADAARLYRRIFLSYPLHPEAQEAKAQLAAIGSQAAPLTMEERRTHADALYAGGRYADAAEEYRALAADPADTDVRERNALRVAAAACDLKQKRLTREQAEALADTPDESGARRLYLLMELARNRDDGDAQQSLVSQMEERFPSSPWLAEALHSSGNMYLLRKDYPRAIVYFEELAARFPKDRFGDSSHWRAAWLNYRLGNYSDAAKLMDVQISQYAGGKEIPAALYWRGRIYEDQEHRPEMAAAYYRTVSTAFEHYYYAQAARERLAGLVAVTPAEVAMLDRIRPEEIPALTDDVPEDDEHVVKARLLANAGLNEFIAPEIQSADGSREWGAFAEAEIYASYGEAFRAMAVLKRAIPFYTSAPIDSIPMGYWKILFPQPYWGTIEEQARKYDLDPYMVASLIRQESEFNARVISYANAWGLMQLLPSVGRSMAREEGIHHFSESELLDPDTNIRLGTRYLSQVLAMFDGRPEFAFAAYNAGANRVTDWQSAGNYHGIDEFVESIPFTETREYVQAILRNEAIYRELNRQSGETHVANNVAQQ